MMMNFHFLILSTSFFVIHAFTTTTCHYLQPAATPTTTVKRHALIFGEDGTMVVDDAGDSVDNDPGTTTLFDDQSVAMDGILLNQEQLIDIGCAFAPPPHDTLHPKEVLSAELVTYQSNELQIALAVQDLGNSVAQVLVSVPLGEASPDNNTMAQDDDLQQLHQRAQEQIQRREWESDHAEELYAKQQQLQEEAYGDDLPLWWTYANLNFLMEEEADLLKKLLNEKDLVLSLFRRQQQQQQMRNDVELARVASIGPSGVILRAALVDKDERETVAVPFEREAKSAEELRKYVLALLEEPTPPSGEEDTTLEEEVPTNGTEQAKKLETKDADDIGNRSSSILLKEQKDEAFQRRLLATRLAYEAKSSDHQTRSANMNDHQPSTPVKREFVLDRWGIHRRNW